MALPQKVTTVAVIGNGIIGHGIAQVFAMAGTPVVMIGRSAASLDKAMANIGASFDQFVAHGLAKADDRKAVLGRIATSTRLEDAAPAELVIEAVTEDLELKLGLFERLDAICPPPAVLGSSSGQPASALTARVRHKERVVATHFWYPPQLLPLVEVCGGPDADPAVVPWICEVLRGIGREPVVIDREIKGFIGNRLQFAMLREAWSLWAKGAASAEAIDAVVRASFGRRVGITGPIESADVGGLDTMYHFGTSLMPDLETAPQPPAAVAELAKAGHRGLSTGKGVYDWSKRDGQALLDARMDELFRWLGAGKRGT